MLYYPEFWLIFVMILIACIIGFKKYIWFISVGYGFSITMVGIMLLFIYQSNLDLFMNIASVLLILYGIRLGGYILYRDVKTSYNKKMKNEISDGSKMNFFVKVMLWISCGLLYFTMTSPIVYRAANGIKSDVCLIIGLVIMLIGIILESTADLQKNAAKKKNKNRFVDTGLYRIVRCPNYFGELVIWTGVFVTSFTALTSIGQWIVAIVGYLGIVYIMFSGARRLEIRQDKNYGDDNEYKKYKKKTPILIPLIPLYSVKKHKWLVG